ncbi:MAG TPA: hypothetical protein VER08_02330 [Pyrinomonadaceae bacterium]|nr:hypothetical protein [Pyrinomonadaceae bacterium]
MKRVGSYCKAYPLESLRRFEGWREDARRLRKERRQVEGTEVETERELGDGDYLFVQQDLTVTDGVLTGENVVFDAVTPEWVEFCKNVLHFKPLHTEGAQPAADE